MASAELAGYEKRFSVYDNAPLETIDVLTIMAIEFGVKAGDITLKSVDPIAFGSFAQVYEAQLYSSEDVVVKVLRPSVVKNLSTDLFMISLTARLVQPFLRSRLLELPAIAHELVRTTRQETDYRREVRMAQYIYGYFADRAGSVVIPRTFADYSTKRIIIQERIRGLALTDVVKVAQSGDDSFAYVAEQVGSDLEVVLRSAGFELLSATLQADFVMADPHPGNIFVLANNHLALIDFGMVTPEPVNRSAFFGMIQQYRAIYEDRADYAMLSTAMMAFYDYDLYQALTMVARDQKLTGSMRGYIVSELPGSTIMTSRFAAEKRISQLFLYELNRGNRFAIRLDARDIVLQKAMHSFLATTRIACGEAHKRDRYWRVVHGALVAAETEALRSGIRPSRRINKAMSLERAQEIVTDWLSVIAEKDQVFYRTLMEGVGL